MNSKAEEAFEAWSPGTPLLINAVAERLAFLAGWKARGKADADLLRSYDPGSGGDLEFEDGARSAAKTLREGIESYDPKEKA